MSNFNDPVSKGFSSFVAGLNSIGSILIVCLMVMINVDVFARFLFNSPIDGVTELVELSIVAIVFLQLGDAVREGKLTRSDGLYSRIKSSYPGTGLFLGTLYDLAGMLFFLCILYGAWPRFIEAWEKDYFAGNQGIFTVPVWPIRLVIVIGCITVAIVFLQAMTRQIAALASRGQEGL